MIIAVFPPVLFYSYIKNVQYNLAYDFFRMWFTYIWTFPLQIVSIVPPEQRGILEVGKRWVHPDNGQCSLSRGTWKFSAGVRCQDVETGVEDGQNWPPDAKVPAQCQEKIEDGLTETKQASYLDDDGA